MISGRWTRGSGAAFEGACWGRGLTAGGALVLAAGCGSMTIVPWEGVASVDCDGAVDLLVLEGRAGRCDVRRDLAIG